MFHKLIPPFVVALAIATLALPAAAATDTKNAMHTVTMQAPISSQIQALLLGGN